MHKKRKGSGPILGAAVVIILVLAALVGGVFQLSPQTESTVTGMAGRTLDDSTVQTGECPDDFETALKGRNIHEHAPSTAYTGVTLYYGEVAENGDVGVESSAAMTVSTAGTLANINANGICGASYEVYTLDDGDYVACTMNTGTLWGATKNVETSCTNSSEVTFRVLDDTLSNVSTVAYAQDLTTSSQAMTTGDTKTYHIWAKTDRSAAQWGSDIAEVTNYICCDFQTAKFSKTNGMLLSGAGTTEMATVPSFCSSNGYDKAWKSTAIASNEQSGYRDYILTLYADMGDPTSAVNCTWVDGHFYNEDGTRKAGIANEALTDIGETNRQISIAVT